MSTPNLLCDCDLHHLSAAGQGPLPLAWGDGSTMFWQDGSVQMGPQPFMWRLRQLACDSCGLSGPLPDWRNMDSLQVLSLARNNLSGLSYFGARRLVSLVLDLNPLGARLEPMLAWGWPLLKHLSMARCGLSGPLPPGQFGGLSPDPAAWFYPPCSCCRRGVFAMPVCFA
jgi:hypothetical protein